jgi:hypothetical protein
MPDIQPRQIREEALGLFQEIPFYEAIENSARSILALLAVEDDIFDLLPLHFVAEQGGAPAAEISEQQLFPLCVAGKLLYAQTRWLDSVLDDYELLRDHELMHSINETLTQRVHALFSEALGRELSCSVFSTLASLRARHSLSLTLDADLVDSSDLAKRYTFFDDYVTQAKARAAPVRASIDAILLLAETPEQISRRALDSFECFAVGAQLYDDALDLEEDFKADRPSWLVCQTLRCMKSQENTHAGDSQLIDQFYETALLRGTLSQNLIKAQGFFDISRKLANSKFPRWAERCNLIASRINKLRSDYEDIVSSFRSSAF